MTINYYKLGQKVRCTVNFTVSGVLTDPTTVTCKVMDPSGNVLTYAYPAAPELVKESTGIYHIDVIADEKKQWNFRFEGTGTCTAVEESTFGVRTVFS
jgi:hypothetical protein